MDVNIEGKISRDDKGLWFTTASGSTWMLRNRPKKDEKDTPPDIVAKVDELLKKGVVNVVIRGDATMNRAETTVVRLEAVEPVEKK